MAISVAAAAAPAVDFTRWTMLHVQGQVGQADSHLITLPDGRHVLVDAGEGVDGSGALVSQLRRHGVERIALLVISHFHADHYGQAVAVADAGILIERVAYNLPDRRVADRERPWGCDFDHVLSTLDALRTRGIECTPVAAGMRLIESVGADVVPVSLDVLCAYDGVNTPIGETDVNDTSIIMRLAHGTTRVLFTGDLNHALGTYLAASDADIRADILKVPHHGTEGCAPNSFFDRVGASTVLVPSPTGLWLSQRSARIREYFRTRGIPALVNGLHGNVVVDLRAGGYRIHSEFGGMVSERELRPRLLTEPTSVVVGTGAHVSLSVTVAASPAATVQWFKDGAPVAGATLPILRLRSASLADAGIYVAVASNPHGEVTSQPATVRIRETPQAAAGAVLTNLSARAHVRDGHGVLIAGFVVGGQGSKALLIRAIGPGLAPFGVGTPLADPTLILRASDGRAIAENDDWSAQTEADRIRSESARVGAFSLTEDGRDASILVSLPPGAYTAVAAGADTEEGIVLIEVYDLEPDAAAHLINLSARAWVEDGDAALIAGFATAGTGELPVLCRAVGPTLQDFGVTEALLRPSLWVHGHTGDEDMRSGIDLDGTRIGDVALASQLVGAFRLRAGDSDVAKILAFPPGVRTAVVRPSPGEPPGVALVEIYSLPAP